MEKSDLRSPEVELQNVPFKTQPQLLHMNTFTHKATKQWQY
jgi:hypothetical protein